MIKNTLEFDFIRKEVDALGVEQSWNHCFELPCGIETTSKFQKSHGKNLVKMERLSEIFDMLCLKNKNILDVGCNEGFFSIEMANRGADVLGIDIDEFRIKKANFVRSCIARESRLNFQIIDIYSPEFRKLPKFDICLCLGFIHRIPDPFSAIAALGSKADVIIFEWKALKFGPHDEAFAYFSPKFINDKDYYGTEYWLLSYAALERILLRLGFKHFHRIDDSTQRRAVLVASKFPHDIFNRPDVVVHSGRLMALLRLIKSSLKSFVGIVSGRINA